jgi:plastocyanin
LLLTALLALVAGLLLAAGTVIAAAGARPHHSGPVRRHASARRHRRPKHGHPHPVSKRPALTTPAPTPQSGPGAPTGSVTPGTQTGPPDSGGAPAPPTGSTTPAAPPPLPSRTGVDEQEYSVYPSHNPVAAGNVEFDVQNLGMDDHDLTITDAAGTRVYGQVYVPAGQTGQVIATLPAGTYRLFCSLYNGAHDKAGMHASLVVK